jgi:hypothetical protein
MNDGTPSQKHEIQLSKTLIQIWKTKQSMATPDLDI